MTRCRCSNGANRTTSLVILDLEVFTYLFHSRFYLYFVNISRARMKCNFIVNQSTHPVGVCVQYVVDVVDDEAHEFPTSSHHTIESKIDFTRGFSSRKINDHSSQFCVVLSIASRAQKRTKTNLSFNNNDPTTVNHKLYRTVCAPIRYLILIFSANVSTDRHRNYLFNPNKHSDSKLQRQRKVKREKNDERIESV